jgi:hypothetical protein
MVAGPIKGRYLNQLPQNQYPKLQHLSIIQELTL